MFVINDKAISQNSKTSIFCFDKIKVKITNYFILAGKKATTSYKAQTTVSSAFNSTGELEKKCSKE